MINYSISINKQIDISVSAAPGETVNVNLPTGLDIYYGGVDVQVVAFTGCTGPCITIQNPLLYRGYTTTTFSP